MTPAFERMRRRLWCSGALGHHRFAPETIKFPLSKKPNQMADRTLSFEAGNGNWWGPRNHEKKLLIGPEHTLRWIHWHVSCSCVGKSRWKIVVSRWNLVWFFDSTVWRELVVSLDHPDLNVSWFNLGDTNSCPARKLEGRPPWITSRPTPAANVQTRTATAVKFKIRGGVWDRDRSPLIYVPILTEAQEKGRGDSEWHWEEKCEILTLKWIADFLSLGSEQLLSCLENGYRPDAWEVSVMIMPSSWSWSGAFISSSLSGGEAKVVQVQMRASRRCYSSLLWFPY